MCSTGSCRLNKHSFVQNCGDLECAVRDETIQEVRFRGDRCMRKFNNTNEKVEASRQVGLKTGSKNLTKAHEMDRVKYCNVCKMKTMHIIGVGCLRCHNNTDVMRKTTTDRNLLSWKDDEYAKRIASNLGKYLGSGVQMKNCDICNEDTSHVGNRCLKCYPNDVFYGISFLEQERFNVLF